MNISNSKKILVSKPIVLIGLSGSGKSSVGHYLSKKLKIKFVDIDLEIEKKEKRSISEIFKLRGEKHFRVLESRSVKQVIMQNKGRLVCCSLGGGAFENSQIRKMLLLDSVVVYLKTSLEVLYQRLKDKQDRPLLKKHNNKTEMIKTIRTMRDKREKNYLKADVTVTTSDKTVAVISKKIIEKLGAYYADC